MQRQLSNVSIQSYQEYQPSRKYGQQYEPGGYSAAVQQRTNMTQREDALKFEQGRIKALQEERLHIQKKTFTKWINSFLQKARMEVEDLFVDLADGRRLLKLLEIISGERLPRPNSGRMRVHKIENVNKSLSFLHTKVRLESIGAEDIVDGNPRLILGLIWTIILRFQIQEIEIDVDEENESSEKKSAKDALLLWCQRKTSGYHGVHIHNFTDSWRSGLGFNALIHAHRPDLFRWTEVPTSEPVETLNHAFDVAHNHLGIPKLLDAEDVDTTRPDEKSVMTYVASYYHTFARMKNEQKSGRRIANIIGQLMDCDARKAEYCRLLTALLEWIRLKITELNCRDFPNSLDGIQRLLLAFKQYRTVEKPPKYKERSEIEALYFSINTMLKSLVGEGWAPADGQLPQDLERAWQQLEQAEHARELALRTELLRQQRLEQLNYKFNTKSVLRKGYLKEMIQVLSDPRYGSNLSQVDATVKKHEAISADILARTERFEDLSAMAAELVRESYHGAEAVSRTEQAVLTRWRELLELLERHRASLAKLAHLMALLREADAVAHTLAEMKAQFDSEEVGRHLVDVERLLQAHALQELQLGALDESIQRLVRQGSAVEGLPQTQQLQHQLETLANEYQSLVAAAKDRKARLEDARNLYQFLEDHDEEEGWVTEKQRICRAEVAAKELRGVLALRQKHTALMHEVRARDLVAQRHRAKGQSLIDAKHPKKAEIERRLSALSEQWEILRQLANDRDKKLADAAEAHQFYGDANEAESWMKEKRALVASDDCGVDAPGAAALLARQKIVHDELRAYREELEALRASADRLKAAGIHTLQLPTEVESSGAAESEEEWGSETRLVPTEVWEEEPVERLEHRTVTEERSVPQVKALYAFTGQGISMAKGEVMFLMNKTNPDWWSVRKADRTDGFVPANYVREIEPRLVPVQVRRPEKVRTVQRVKKTVLVKQVVPVRRNVPARRRGTVHQAPPVPPVGERMNHIDAHYAELLQLSEARRAQLEDAIKLYSFFAECDDFDKWMKEKEKMLRTDDKDDSVENAKRKYEKFVTDLSAASKRLERIDAAAEELVAAKHSQAAKATARKQQLRQQWERLLRLKQQKEKSLEGASSVELFNRTCDEALDWMCEKEQQLEIASAPAADLRTVQALQRRHAQLERELEPLREKVHTVTLLADSVKSQYPTERTNVEGRQKEIESMWVRCHAQAAERRSRLESAVGHQIFGNSSAQLQDWVEKVREQVASDVTAKDVATAEALVKHHQELQDDIKAHDDEFKEVIGLGKQLLGNNPSLTDVRDRIQQLEGEQKAVHREWQEKDQYLKQLLQLQSFNREADQIDASSGAHEAFLDYQEYGSSVDEAETLVKRQEEAESRLAAQDERVSAFAQRANALATQKPEHYATEHILARRAAVLQRREKVRHALAERRRALLANLAHQQFVASTEELQAWIQDKTQTANDQSYRELANLERKLQKHEAFERELQANEKQLRNVESIGQSLQKSDPNRAANISERLDKLQTSWEQLVAASRDKGSKLRQASQQRQHRRAVEDAKARLADLERELNSEEIGTDLRSCKRLLNQHQALEQELSQMEQRAQALSVQGADLVSGGHFDSAAIQRDCSALQNACASLRPRAVERRRALESSLQLHKLAAEVTGEIAWVDERRAAASSTALPQDLHAAQTAQKKHAKLRAELQGRKPLVQRVLERGEQLPKNPQADKIKQLCKELEGAYSEISQAADERAARLETALKAQQFLHDALEVDSWLADKAAELASADVGNDRHRATQLLTRHKAVELELDTYAAIISEMGHVAGALAASGGPEGEALVERHEQLSASLARLQRRAALRQAALVESVCRHEYLAESAELESWIQEQYGAASSEDYGQDYEHLLVLRSKFEELRHRVESGAERFSQCEELAKKLLASNSPYIGDIEARQEALGESWQRLVEQIESRARRLHAAGEIHRFHRDASELLARAADRRAQLSEPAPPRDLRAAEALLRNHTTAENDLLAIDAQMQVLQEEGSRLQKLCPGGNEQQIALRQRALSEAWSSLRAAADARKTVLHHHHQLQQLLSEIRDVMSWSSELRSQMSASLGARSAATAQAQRAHHDALRAEIDARDDTFRDALAHGQQLVDDGHPNAQEIEERCNALVDERGKLHAAWAARQVALDQLIDWHCFLRDAKQLHDLCTAQEAALSTEISPTLSVEEVENLLKKHEAFEKLLATQDEKLSTLNSHGDKLLQQNHVESQRIADELRAINERRKKLYASAAERRARLLRARARAQFSRDANEARGWLADKLAMLNAQHGEVTSLEDKMKKLQKHQAFTAELAANRARLQEVEELAQQLGPEKEVVQELQQLREDWRRLEKAAEETGRGLEEAQDILEFNQHLEKIEAWIRDKEMMVQANEVGRDYEHCSALLRKLDDLDSDMQVDDKHVKNVCALADKLLKQGPSQQADVIKSRRDACLSKWQALSGALQRYRDRLSAALQLHSFNRDVEDTAERIAKKAALFSSNERGRELQAAYELKRRHQARAAEASAIGDKIEALRAQGTALAKSHPDHASEIEESLSGLDEAWDRVKQLGAKRSALLDDAIAEHKFEESLKELELWVSETVKRMSGAEPESVSHAEGLLEMHHERKAEIDGRQKVISSLQKEADQAKEPEKVKRVEKLSSTLDQAWLQRKNYLTQAHELQLLNEQARQVEDWLAAKEAFLNNDDLGENLDAVETLIRKHTEFAKLLESQIGRVDELGKFGSSLLEKQHQDSPYIETRIKAIRARANKLKETCVIRGKKLEQSKQLHQFLRDLTHEREWIELKMQIANDHNYRELSNLQSKMEKQSAFESELAANKRRIDDVAAAGEKLIEAEHYASQEIARHVEDLENLWRELQHAAKLRRDRLQEAYQARVFLRGLDDFVIWLDDIETQLLSEDHGKDLSSVCALLKKHTRLEQGVASKAEVATQLADTATHLADTGHFMSDEILEKTEQAVKRYRQLQEPMQIRRDNLEDAALLHRWERDADEELHWLREREGAVRSEEAGATLPEAQALLKKHSALEAEIIARESTVNAVCSRASSLARRGHFAGNALETRSRDLKNALKTLLEAAALRSASLKDRVLSLQLLSEMWETEAWLVERKTALSGGDTGRDEESVLGLVRRLEAQQRELTAFLPSVTRLEKAAQERMNEDDVVKKKMEDVKELCEELKLLSAKRQQRLQQSLKYFKFVQECEEVQEWISEQMTVAASEEYGLDVEHVDTLQQAFDNFLQQLHASEGRIEAVCEGGTALLEENTPEADRVKQKMEDIRGLWDDLKELAVARQEALAGARQVHEFDRSAEETLAWVAEKEATLQLLKQLHQLKALRADLNAIREKHAHLKNEADRLGAAFPDAKEHVQAKLEDVTEALEALEERAAHCEQQLQLADQLQAYFDTYQELMAWTNETMARVTAPELGSDVAAAERLVARHRDISPEMDAKDDAFHTFYADGEKLVSEGHFLSSEVEGRMSALRARRSALSAAWQARATIYEQHLDALIFLRDAEALDQWISARVPLVRDGKYGDSVAQTEELINRHRDLEETIDAQKEKFNALKRITLIESAFKEQKQEEEQARKRQAEHQEAERLRLVKRREMERIAEERRRESGSQQSRQDVQMERQLSNQDSVVSSEETFSPAPQFDRLPKSDALVKRAESMSVATKTPKRTPSFTTRRRTQSFRRHRQPDELPPVEIEGYLERKQEAGVGGKRATVRSWRSYYGVLCGQLLCFFRDQTDFASSKAAAPPVAILNARCEPASDYTKRAHVFRLSCTDGAEYLFACARHELMMEWVAKISFHAALPPQLQLTPYEASSPADDVRRRLRNASTSSSATSSPDTQRKVRTQSEILKEHRAANTPERNIESSVLPSLPPRQPPQEDEIILRNSEHVSGSWGRTRFSNGRDINAEFLRTQREASSGQIVTERPPAIPERAPVIPERGPIVPDRSQIKQRPERVSVVSDRASVMSDRGSVMSDRGSVMSDRASVMSDRASVRSERVSSDREFDKNSNERNSASERSSSERFDKNSNERYENYRYTERSEGPTVSQGDKSVTAMVNSYQQKVNKNWQEKEKNPSWNNNWQGVETTSHFYSASELAYGGNSGSNTRPASVAGSGGSPALDQRPASRSSGESELSVGGTKEKKDKKGVFGGLFSRKKRPQSHM
ncbi:spectrin beta chain, non-erythrocytic 1 isoform X1 [Pieris rapae]|uniref:spectrin beta chain, non-erythrocytic 1 isoform X1 n=2 Tax=Pieris rapae TaxID=64459 RepID=UPI001E27C52D|nr:spectrin beta chain, non-erythrocytic 1 isoform X1 [Pieris rapae]XP_045489790.1 spectrin beta chain, non-erythrocytic 1 isoform X1 [Pieris rapae]XP_045489791.1 spectrin beta chain, non-erythrocytic 1 isoform X1 [Pieris rapae]XP_045489792.1 spectrin beta chain, non-erythrocytic 1 isoform X1 [Pieris rapae]XP_045489793.1 spectrin beta chain, non-erythrocytic 1 isoform X1 [Pieris rapae]